MRLQLKSNLPFVTITVTHAGKMTKLDNILIDTGSASTILAADQLIKVGIEPAPNDTLHTIRGVGGTEVVFLRLVDFLEVRQKQLADFEIEVGGMDYGFDINGILGMDFLTKSGAIINLPKMQLEFA